MADSSIAITPGSGANVDGFTQAGGDFRQAMVLGDASAAATATVGPSGGLSVMGAAVTGTSAGFSAAATGTAGPLDVHEAGNATFYIKNTTAASPFGTGGTFVFEQSDDNTSWGPLVVVRSDTGWAGSTHVLPANTANGEFLFDAALEGVNFVRCRVTVGPPTNGFTVVIDPGGMPFSPVVTAILNRDTNRNRVSYGTASAGVTAGTSGTDAMQVLAQQFKGGTSQGTTGTSFAVTTGKTFRVQSLSVAMKVNAATVGVGVFTLRYNPSGAAVATSEPVAELTCAVGAVSGSADKASAQFGDGLDLPSGGQFGVSCLPTWTTTAATLYAFITGYEF